MLENENTPGRKALQVKKETELIFKTPTVPKKRKKILQEETYVEQIGKIIQRDFFPSLEKLKAQNDYLDAVEKNDVKKLRELYAKYSGKKPTERLPSPATFETPTHDPNATKPMETKAEEPKAPPARLDQFLSAHTSEDNESFEEILEDAARQHRQKYAYLYRDEGTEEKERQLALPSIEQQCALPEKRLDVDTWSYRNRNYAMFVPDGVEPYAQEIAELERKKLTVVYDNTRLSSNPFDEHRSKETIGELARTQAKVLDGRIGVDGKEVTAPASPRVAGYGFVREPTPRVAVPDSPLMTWGEIDGTPFRLDGGGTPRAGPAFTMSAPTRRERLAHELAEKASGRERDKKKRAIDAARRQFATPSPRTNLDRLATMSPAARRLLVSPKTPRRAPTPAITWGGAPKTPKEYLTDDLLKINVRKRNTAADFF